MAFLGTPQTGGPVQHAMVRKRTHPAEPAAGTFRASSGEDADLFDLTHYPVRAVCRVCSQPIKAETFLRAFQHC